MRNPRQLPSERLSSRESMSAHESLPTPPAGDDYVSTSPVYVAEPSWSQRSGGSHHRVQQLGLGGSNEHRRYHHGHSIHQLLNPNVSELSTFPPTTPESLPATSEGGPLYPPYQHLRYSKDSNDAGAAGRLGEFLFGRKVATSVGSLQRSDRVGVEIIPQEVPPVFSDPSQSLVSPGVWEKDELPETLKDHLSVLLRSSQADFAEFNVISVIIESFST